MSYRTECAAGHFSENGAPHNATPPGAPRQSFLSRLNDHKTLLTAWALGLSLAILLLWPHMIITITPGHVGVLYKRFLGGTVMDRLYPEGTHVLLPWNTMFIFDTRLHEEKYSCTVPTGDGLLITLEVTAYYHPQADKTPVLLTTVGQNYREKLILPALEASVRGAASQHDAEAFYTDQSNAIQGQIHVLMMQAMARHPVIVDNFFIRTVMLPDKLNKAIEGKVTALQNVLEASERYKAKFIEAQAVKMAQETVNPGLTEPFLRWQGVEATRKLAESDNAKLVVVGGKDGLPIILNTEDKGARPLQPRNSTESAVTAPEQDEGAPFSERISPDKLREGLSRIEKLFGEDLLQKTPGAPGMAGEGTTSKE